MGKQGNREGRERGMRTEFLEPSSPRWPEVLAKTSHGPHHLPGYVECAARHEAGRACAFWAECGGYELLIPLIVRDIPLSLAHDRGYCDACSPYGYAAPLIYPVTRCVSDPCGAPIPEATAQTRALLEAFQRTCAERRIVSVFLRWSPLLAIPEAAFDGLGETVRHSECVYVDLRQDEEALWRQLRHSYRQQIRKLERAGFECVIDHGERIRDFSRLYRRSMERLDAESFYFFSDQFFEELCTVFKDKLQLCLLTAPDGTLVASTLQLIEDGVIEGFLAGSDDAHHGMAITKLCWYRVMQYGRAHGLRFFNLGGGVGSRDDGLLFCKRGFSPLSAPFHTFRMIADQQAYAECVACAAQARGGVCFEPDYFPLYRQGQQDTSKMRCA